MSSVSLGAMIRAVVSTPPPGANGTTSRTGRVGYAASAAAASPGATHRPSAVKMCTRRLERTERIIFRSPRSAAIGAALATLFDATVGAQVFVQSYTPLRVI